MAQNSPQRGSLCGGQQAARDTDACRWAPYRNCGNALSRFQTHWQLFARFLCTFCVPCGIYLCTVSSVSLSRWLCAAVINPVFQGCVRVCCMLHSRFYSLKGLSERVHLGSFSFVRQAHTNIAAGTLKHDLKFISTCCEVLRTSSAVELRSRLLAHPQLLQVDQLRFACRIRGFTVATFDRALHPAPHAMHALDGALHPKADVEGHSLLDQEVDLSQHISTHNSS